MKYLSSLMFAVMGSGVAAQSIEACDNRASLWSVVEPLEDHTRTFANGDVRLTLTDTIEPAIGSFHIVVVGPPYDELGGPRCRIVTGDFGGIEFDRLQAEYDPSRGLVWRVPVKVYDPVRGDFGTLLLTFTLDQSTGDMTAYLAG